MMFAAAVSPSLLSSDPAGDDETSRVLAARHHCRSRDRHSEDWRRPQTVGFEWRQSLPSDSVSAAPRMATRKYTAGIHSSATVPHATNDAPIASGSLDDPAGVWTRFVLFTAACITIVSSRLPRVRQYNQARATDSAVTPRP